MMEEVATRWSQQLDEQGGMTYCFDVIPAVIRRDPDRGGWLVVLDDLILPPLQFLSRNEAYHFLAGVLIALGNTLPDRPDVPRGTDHTKG